MLVLSRGVNDSIIITDKKTGKTLEIKITSIFHHPELGKGVKLSFKADECYEIMRTELCKNK